MPITVAAEPLSEPEQVTVLELGGVVVSHGPVPDGTRTSLEQLISERYSGRAALTAYDALAPGEVALTAWGALQRCESLDPPAVDAFIAHYAQR